jgi:hypothetical protein
MKKRILTITLLSVIFLSCESDRIRNLEYEISNLEKRIKKLNLLEVKTTEGILRSSEKEDGKDYWEINTYRGIHFVYHRKNESELWQPVFDSYILRSTVRIFQKNLTNEQYLVVTIPAYY